MQSLVDHYAMVNLDVFDDQTALREHIKSSAQPALKLIQYYDTRWFGCSFAHNLDFTLASLPALDGFMARFHADGAVFRPKLHKGLADALGTYFAATLQQIAEGVWAKGCGPVLPLEFAFTKNGSPTGFCFSPWDLIGAVHSKRGQITHEYGRLQQIAARSSWLFWLKCMSRAIAHNAFRKLTQLRQKGETAWSELPSRRRPTVVPVPKGTPNDISGAPPAASSQASSPKLGNQPCFEGNRHDA